METKACSRCHLELPVSEFWKHNKYGYQPWCKSCKNQYKKENPELARKYSRDYNYRTGRNIPLGLNDRCASYLGDIAERALLNFFDNIHRMPTGNPGYDFICGKGFKIDVKGACLSYQKYCILWDFGIRRNKIPDYFLLLAFNDRESLDPQHVWLVPGEVINDHMGIGISNTPKGLARFAKYERSLDRVASCMAVVQDGEHNLERCGV